MPTQAKGWGTDAADQPLKPMEFERRDLRADDVAIRISHAGICHSDLHTCRNDWGGSAYPVVPGHEIVGTVTDDRRRRDQACRRRHRRGRLHGRQLHGVRPVPRRVGSVLPRGLHPDLQQPRPVTAGRHQGRLFGPYRRARPFRVQGAQGHGRRARRALAVRRDHDLFAAAPIWRRQGHQGGGRRAWRAGPHGGQAGRGDGRARDDDHHHAREGRGCAQAGRARRHRVDRCRRR